MKINARRTSISRHALGCACLIAAAPALAGDDLQARIDAFTGQAGAATLDARTVQPCSQQPAIDWYGSLHRAVTVTCAGSPGWHVFVPMRGLASGAASATAASSFAPVVIKRGDAVQISAGGAGFQISSAGQAEQDGRAGGRVRVRLANGTVTNAVVESAGNVSLPGYSSETASR